MTDLLHALTVAALVVVSYLYWRAFRRCRTRRGGPISIGRSLIFLAGVGLVVGALLSPLESASEGSLAAHMFQHVLLLVAPLALLASRTGSALLLGLDPHLRSRVAPRLQTVAVTVSPLWRRPAAWSLLAVTLGAWHLPAAFQAAAMSPSLHAAEHAMFFAAAGVWWLSLVGTGRGRLRHYGASMLSVFGMMLLGTAVGALLTFSTRPWYPLYAARIEAAGGDWLADQQLAGLIMWIPPGVLLLVVFIWLASTWLRSVESGTEAPRVTT